MRQTVTSKYSQGVHSLFWFKYIAKVTLLNYTHKRYSAQYGYISLGLIYFNSPYFTTVIHKIKQKTKRILKEKNEISFEESFSENFMPARKSELLNNRSPMKTLIRQRSEGYDSYGTLRKSHYDYKKSLRRQLSHSGESLQISKLMQSDRLP